MKIINFLVVFIFFSIFLVVLTENFYSDFKFNDSPTRTARQEIEQVPSYFTLLKQQQEREKKEKENLDLKIKKEKEIESANVTKDNFINSEDNFDLSEYFLKIFEDPILTQKKISIEAGPAKISDIILLIGKSSGLDFIIDSDVVGDIGKISFNDLTVGQILNHILTHNKPQLVIVKDLNTFRIMLRTKAEEFLRLNNPNQIDTTSKIFNVNNVSINDKFKDLVEKTWISIVGNKKTKSPIFFDSERKKIYVRGSNKNITEFESFLKEIDKEIVQIRIDAIIVFCQKNYNFDYGINWSGIYNRLNTIKLKKTSFGFVGLGGRLDDFPTPTKPINKKDGNLFVDPENFAINLFSRVFRTPGAADPVEISNTAITIPFVFGGPDLNLRRLNLLLKAAESESKVKIVSRPSIVTSDNETAKILIGATIPLQATAIDVLSVAVQNISSINYKDVGISLEVHPVVGADKRTIKLEIFIEESEVVSGSTRTNERGVMMNPPVIDIIKVHNKVNLRNGQTVVIGGLSSCDERKGKNRVPILGQLPLIGKLLFTGTSEFKREFEQYVFITPTILENKC